MRTVRLQIVASLFPWNFKAVGSSTDQPATFPEKSLVRLLAVAVGVGVGVCGVSFALFSCFCGPLGVCSYERLKLVGGLVICKMDLMH